MTSIPLRSPPSTSGVQRHQVRTVGLGIRREGIAFLLILTVVWVVQGLVAMQARTYPVHDVSVRYSPEMAFPLWWIGLFLPLVVWRGEERARRMYLWSMPVDVSVNTLLKVFAGWLWMMAIVAVYLLFVNVLSLTQGLIAGDWPYANDRVWEWAVPFAASTVAYLLASALVVGSKYPVRWFAGIIVSVWLVPIVIALFHAWSVEDIWHSMWDGWGGISVLLSAHWALERMVQRATLAQWGLVATLWLLASAAAVWVAAHRRPDA